jgi:hypothetical protein
LNCIDLVSIVLLCKHICLTVDELRGFIVIIC